MTAQRLVISGRVQGVGYRAWFAQLAKRKGLAGWVRNRKDGTVEALVSGERDDVAAVIAEARNGPMLSRVDRVTLSESTDVVPQHFEIRPSA